MDTMLHQFTRAEFDRFGECRIESCRIVQIEKLIRENHRGFSSQGYFYNYEALQAHAELNRTRGCWWSSWTIPALEIDIGRVQSIVINVEDKDIYNLVNLKAETSKLKDLINYKSSYDNKYEIFLKASNQNLLKASCPMYIKEARHMGFDRFDSTSAFDYIGKPLEWWDFGVKLDMLYINNVLNLFNKVWPKLHEKG